MYKRHNYSWSINEILRLQREYELLGLNISEIANLHQRSENSILYKIKKEGFIFKVSYENIFCNIEEQYDVDEYGVDDDNIDEYDVNEYDPYNLYQQLTTIKKLLFYIMG
jgi:hypothetical protein